MRHHNGSITGTLQRPGARPFKTPDEAVDKTAFSAGAVSTIGTPDDLVERIKSVLEIGGFGMVIATIGQPEGAELDMGWLCVVLEMNDMSPENCATCRTSAKSRCSPMTLTMAKILDESSPLPSRSTVTPMLAGASASNIVPISRRCGRGLNPPHVFLCDGGATLNALTAADCGRIFLL